MFSIIWLNKYFINITEFLLDAKKIAEKATEVTDLSDVTESNSKSKRKYRAKKVSNNSFLSCPMYVGT